MTNSRPVAAAAANVDKATVSARVLRYAFGAAQADLDTVACEEPLEIAVRWEGAIHMVSVTLRTPGDDVRLALGFLHSEGIIRSRDDVASASSRESKGSTLTARRVLVSLRPSARFAPDGPRRNFPISAACGACGQSALEVLRITRVAPFGSPKRSIEAERVVSLAASLAEAQPGFAKTGGLHAAGRFSSEGKLIAAAEDIGRHNALDKLAGQALQDGAMDWTEDLIVTSGRIGFDLMQKALALGCPCLVGVGAPSSLAVELANLYRMTLVGFLRADRFNVYSGADRILP